MISDHINTGVKPILKSLSAGEAGKEWGPIRFVVVHAGWFLMFFVWGIYLLSPELRAKGFWIYGWLSVYLIYQVVLEVLSRAKKRFYETPGFRRVRVQVMVFLGSALLLLTDSVESYFWFVYLLPLFASALYFETWAATWGVYGEIAALYFLVSWIATGSVVSINFALWLVNLAVLLLLSAVLRYLAESIRKYQVAERKLKYSEILHQIQQDIDTAIDLQEVLDRIIRRAVQLAGARDGTLMLRDEKDELRFRARCGRSLPEGKVERTFKPGEGVAGLVVRSGKPYVCHDTKVDAHFIPIIAGMDIRSMISVPIISHGTVLGVINVDSTEPNRFSEADAELLVTLANQTAVAIERAELLESLRRIGEKTLGGVKDPHQRIVDAIHWLTRCPIAMWRMDETGKKARIVASRGVRTEYIQEAVVDLDRRSVTGKAIREHKIVQVLDIQADPDFQNKEAAAREGWQSYLAVPLLAGPERAVGTLSIYSERKREQFTRWELDLLRTFAGQAGVVTRNADLVRELVVLNKIGQAVSVLGVEAIANLVYQETSKLMDTTNFFLCLYDKEKNRIDIKTWMYNGQPLEPFFRELTGLTGWVVREKKSLLIRDWDKEEKDFPVKADIITERQRSWLGAPLLIGEEVLGVMSVQSPRPKAFDLDTQRLLEIIANQAAVAIENARLYEESQNRLKLLNALHETSLDIVRRLNLGELMPAIIERAADLMAGGRHKGIGAAYWRCDHETRTAIIEYSSNPTLVGVELGFDEGLVSEVIRMGKAKYVNNYPQWAPHAFIFDRGDLAGLIENIIEVPVKKDGKVVAILAISDASGQRLFGDADIELLECFASLAAIAIQNAYLHENLQRRVKGLEMLNQVAGRISISLDRQEIFQTVVEAVRITLGTTHCTLFILDDDGVLVPRATAGVPFEVIEKRRFRLGEGLAGWVAREGQSTLVLDANKDQRFLPGMTAKPGTPRSMVLAPLRVKGKVIGVFSADQDRVAAFDENDRQLLDTLSVQVANTMLYWKLQQHIAELESTREQLVDAEKMLVMSRFATDFIHRVNNMVGTIPIWTQQIQERLQERDFEDDDVDFYLSHISADVKRVRYVTTQLIEATTQNPIREMLDIVDLMQIIACRIRVMTSDAISTVEKYPSEPVFVYAVRIELETTLWDIAWNGVQAIMPIGTGTLTLNVDRVSPSCQGAQGQVHIEIHDNGIGVPPGQPVFTALFSTKGGFGYGLWRAKKVVEELRGTIGYKSVPGDTMFWIELPEAVNEETDDREK